ncbi:MAG: ABC transporter permease [Bacillota bacterium]|nr:ABC transporter permease [Bacillota bacterium]
MNFAETCKMAWKNLMSSKARSFLTMLGIIIGVTSVVVIMGIGAANAEQTKEEYRRMGVDVIDVQIKGRGGDVDAFRFEDLQKIVWENSEYLTHATPLVSLSSELRNGTKKMEYSDIRGISTDFFTITNLKLEEGRILRYVDEWKRADVCVIGSYVNKTLFQGRGLGQNLQIDGKNFEIVGVLKEMDPFLGEWGSDNRVLLPYSTASRMNQAGKGSFQVATVSEEYSEKGTEILNEALQEFFRDNKAYRVTNNASLLKNLEESQKRQMMSMALIAGISLVVGGIGIMNIMLVSVTERTREIGIRKALGAKQKYILRQFMIESGVTSGMGGVIGVLLSYPICYAARELTLRFTGQMLHIEPDLQSIVVSVGISVAVGVFFGFMPARKAAMLNPIEALRHN